MNSSDRGPPKDFSSDLRSELKKRPAFVPLTYEQYVLATLRGHGAKDPELVCALFMEALGEIYPPEQAGDIAKLWRSIKVRDDFLVSRGLWSDFVDSLPSGRTTDEDAAVVPGSGMPSNPLPDLLEKKT